MGRGVTVRQAGRGAGGRTLGAVEAVRFLRARQLRAARARGGLTLEASASAFSA